MPYRLKISKEEVEAELSKLGFDDVPPEMIESFRKDLLKLIKSDLKKLKESQTKSSLPKKFEKDNIESNSHQLPTTSTPSSYLEFEKEKTRTSAEVFSTSEYGSGTFSASMESSFSEASASASEVSKSSDTNIKSTKEPLESVRSKDEGKCRKALGKNKDDLPSYPERPDPVNLYHFYKAHWDKFKAPGEDPRSALRWEVRSKLFYSS